MRCDDLLNKRVVIWGTGKEGCAAARYLRDKCPACTFTFVDENAGAQLPDELSSVQICADCAQALNAADVVIKSPGVSLYHPLLETFKARGGSVTSLMNLWMAENENSCVVAITGSKGKSTTTSLLVHVLEALGKKAVALGNIGIPVTECVASDYDVCVLEVSSYQAANFDGAPRIGVLTSLFPEHLDWHKTLEAYYRDKCNLLAHCKEKLVEKNAAMIAAIPQATLFNDQAGFHIVDAIVQNGTHQIAPLENEFLLRRHNHGNVCAVMAVIEKLNLDLPAALKAMQSYRGLPHRQQAICKIAGVHYIDDSISTTPQSAIAAMQAFAAHPITLIAGGQDRGIDFSGLCSYIAENDITVVCLGESGLRIHKSLCEGNYARSFRAATMEEAVLVAQAHTSKGGVILLSPASPSYDMYKDYIDRASYFIKAVTGR